MRRKRLILLFALLILAIPAGADIGQVGLDNIINNAKAELYEDWTLRLSEQERLNKVYDEQHARMLEIIKESNDLSMSLYLQKKDYIFDLSYALHRVADKYRDFNRNRTPYDIIVRDLDLEIDRYARFLEALRRLPPEIQMLDVVPDSLTYHNDSLDTFISSSGSSLQREVMAIALADTLSSPLVLSASGQADRDSCLRYAGELLSMYASQRALVLADSLHYKEAQIRLKESYDYASDRYEVLKKEIFIEGQSPWWEVLSNFSYYWKQAKDSFRAQYDFSFGEMSEYELQSLDSRNMNGLMVIMVTTLLFTLFAIWLVCRFLLWLLCLIKRVGANIPKQKRRFFALIPSVLIYLLLYSSRATDVYSLELAVSQIATFLWLLLAIDTALLIRLKPERIGRTFHLYIPTIFLALAVIIFRVSNIPNMLLNCLFPPILSVFSLWQLVSCLMGGRRVEKSDRYICWISFAVTVISLGLSVTGYIFIALMSLMWWFFQLAAIHTLVTIGYLNTRYHENRVKANIRKDTDNILLSTGADKTSRRFRVTWFYELVIQVVVPCLALASIPLCIRYSLDIFDFDDLYRQIYTTPFVKIPGANGEIFFTISLESAIWVTGLFCVFNYANKAIHALWQWGRYTSFTRKNNRKTIRANEINLSLGNSLISVGLWFLYIVAIVQILNIPTGSLSLAIGGLSAGIGLALKDIINNFIYGIQLMSGRLRVGDWIECEGVRGQVTEINYQSTQVLTTEATIVSFLNATLFGKSFTNLTRGNSYELLKIQVGVPYGSDVQKVREIIEKAMEVMKTKDKYGRDVVDPKHGIYIRFGQFGTSSVDIVVKQYVLAAEHILYRDRAQEIIYNALQQNGVTIPFPQCDVHIIKD